MYLLKPDVVSISHRAQLVRLPPSKAVHHFWALASEKPGLACVHGGKMVTKNSCQIQRQWCEGGIMTLHQSDHWLNLDYGQVLCAHCRLHGCFLCILVMQESSISVWLYAEVWGIFCYDALNHFFSLKRTLEFTVDLNNIQTFLLFYLANRFHGEGINLDQLHST